MSWRKPFEAQYTCSVFCCKLVGGCVSGWVDAVGATHAFFVRCVQAVSLVSDLENICITGKCPAFWRNDSSLLRVVSKCSRILLTILLETTLQYPLIDIWFLCVCRILPGHFTHDFASSHLFFARRCHAAIWRETGQPRHPQHTLVHIQRSPLVQFWIHFC